MMLRRASLALLLGLAAAPLHAQDPLGWNAPRALELIERARVRRELPRGDSTLRNYQAAARGFVYFYLDRREDDERTLVKVDQIALELFWQRPNLTKQRIIGLRDVSRLPNRMRYHLDHLTVVQNNLGDRIRLGDGDEVRDVPHPAAPGADSIYDFRLADSVTLQLGGGADVRVYELQVRPKRTDRSAFVGSVFVDRDAADIVRMTFTFTPASYVDRRLDYIHISLDNALFGGKYWLPNEQSVEIRRQIPELDFAAGAVIKGRMRITDYAFNQELPDSIFFGRTITAVPPHERETFAFEDSIYAGVNAEGLAPPPQMEALREQAAKLLGEARLSGLPPLRLYVPNASSVFRHNDAEGSYLGGGLTYSPSPTFQIDATGGYAFGLEAPEATAAARIGPADDGALLRGYYNQPRDMGMVPGLPGVFNTFNTLFDGRDFTNLYFTRGVAAEGFGPANLNWNYRFGLFREWHEPAPADTFELSRPGTAAVSEGRATGAFAAIERPLTGADIFSWGAAFTVQALRFAGADTPPAFGDDIDILRILARAELRSSSSDRRRDLFADVHFGRNTKGVPGQYFFRIGGRETVPGYAYRSLISDRQAGYARVEYSNTLAAPWLRVRTLLYGGMTDARRRPADVLLEEPGRSFRGSAGVGVGLLWDVIRIDVVKGDEWQTLFSVRRDFWGML